MKLVVCRVSWPKDVGTKGLEPRPGYGGEKKSDISKPRVLTLLVEKLERLAARLRHPRQQQTVPSQTGLEAALDAMLLETDNGTVLPSSQHIDPNQKSAWKRTQDAMMPKVKTKHAKAGDSVYGAGESSGKKAKEQAKKPQRTLRLPT
ncbi:hypothetical protein B0H16DRAFT_1712090 [Mycena metata]|uniref:Uncharacterized protein n=1 Tax=Mycena metata TaxID=1033252 RepID=A0AAD7K4L5_9AGAR|nr:hypothetical protein B0H16DRAFT_1712090 [Mycena metata]